MANRESGIPEPPFATRPRPVGTDFLGAAPLFPVAVGWIVGIACDRFLSTTGLFILPPSIFVLFYLLMFAVTSAVAMTRRRLEKSKRSGFDVSIPACRDLGVLTFLASVCVGGMLHVTAVRIIPASGLERYVGGARRDSRTNSRCASSVSAADRIVRLRGQVVSEPRNLGGEPSPFGRWSYRGERTAFLLEASAIEGIGAPTPWVDPQTPIGNPESAIRNPQSAIGQGIPVTGRVRVVVGEAVLDLRQGERVELFGLLYPLKPPVNPGSFDWAALRRRQGIVAGLLCNHSESIRRLDDSSSLGESPSSLSSFILQPSSFLRSQARGLLTDDLATAADEEASLLEAMVLGHRSQLDRHLNDVFIKAGCIHFLAVSGIHVVVAMFYARLVARALGRTRRAQIWAMMAAVVLYLLVAEPRPPILRASVIALLFCIACLLGRQRACLNWISASAIVLALVDPAMVFDVGYQLSFAAVLGVSYLAPALVEASGAGRRLFERAILRRPLAAEGRRLMRPPSGRKSLSARLALPVWRGSRRYVPRALAVTFAAWLAALPIVAFTFQRVHPWGPINSFVVLPLMSVVMGLGFAKVLASMISPTLGALVAGLVIPVDSFLIWFVEHLASLPGAALWVTAPPWWLTASYYVFLLLFAFRFSAGVRYGVHVSTPDSPDPRGDGASPAVVRRLSVACCTALGLLALSSIAWCNPIGTSDRLVVTCLAVGSGTATVIELPNGKTVLYDAGSARPYDVGRSTVVPFLRHRGIRKIDRVYISHANMDHFSGLPTIIDEIDTGPIIVNGYFEPQSTPNSPSRHLLELLAARDHAVEILDPAVTTWELGGVKFELLGPAEPQDDTISLNDASMVLRLSYGGHDILLTGDIEAQGQEALLRRDDLEADVLLLPHHGSVKPSLGAFLEAVGPKILVRSSHRPMAETFSGLSEIVGARRLFNTADVGAVRVILTSDGIDVRCGP